MKFFKVVLYSGERIVHSAIVRSRESRTALSNTLVNIYKGEVDKATATEVKVKETREIVNE